jgi:hypothetical protein
MSDADLLTSFMDGMLVNDTNTMKAAEHSLKKAMKTEACIAPLFQLMQSSPKAHVRQMSALFIWRRINKFWMALAPHHETIKNGVLICLQNEPEFRIRKAMCCICAALAKHLLPDNNWPALLVFLNAAAQAPSADHREMAMLLFQALTDTVAQHMTGQCKLKDCCFLNFKLFSPLNSKIFTFLPQF